MAKRKRGNKAKAKTQTKQRSVKSAVGATFKKRKPDKPTASAPHADTTAGPGSEDPNAAVVPLVDDPESIIRKARKARKAQKAAQAQDTGQAHETAEAQETARAQDQRKSPYRLQPDDLVQSIEAALIEVQHKRSRDDSSDDTSSTLGENLDPEQAFNNKWGYLPPLDEESAAAVMDELMEDPSRVKELARINAYHQNFPMGLINRNVSLEESTAPDDHADHIQRLETQQPPLETEKEKESYGHLWNMDQAKCSQGSNEALFQRTIMMSLIARHCLIYDGSATNRHVLDFNVEEPWSCPPMPTRAYMNNEKFLTQPKPDLAVSFRRQELISELFWRALPTATKRLACHENISETGMTRVFPFFTIEAKKEKNVSSETIAIRQSLNNASQALHNMFEFCRDAGPEHAKIFFEKVRFFSVIASKDGVLIHIHRATQELVAGSGLGLIMEDRPEYPLAFEHRQFCELDKRDLHRSKVFEVLERILVGYGVHELHPLLQEAARALVTKLTDNPVARRQRTNDDYYRYGQILKSPPRSKTQTSANTRASSLRSHVQRAPSTMGPPPPRPRSHSRVSIDMLRSGHTTPTRTQPGTATQSPKGKRKRGRSQSEDTGATKKARKSKQ